MEQRVDHSQYDQRQQTASNMEVRLWTAYLFRKSIFNLM
jgi:hypothetical protein